VLLSVIIPAYNEAERLPATLVAATRYVAACDFEAEVWVVNDGSGDRTAEVAKDHVGVKLLDRGHAGKGAAVRAGMLAAAGEYRMLCDADLAMRFETIDGFLEVARQERVDIVIGTREGPDAQRENETALGHFRGRVFNTLVQLLALPAVEDSQCGYKLFSAKAAEAIFPQAHIDGFAFDVEALVLANRLGFEWRELPIHWHHNRDSRVNSLRHSLQMMWDVLRVTRR